MSLKPESFALTDQPFYPEVDVFLQDSLTFAHAHVHVHVPHKQILINLEKSADVPKCQRSDRQRLHLLINAVKSTEQCTMVTRSIAAGFLNLLPLAFQVPGRSVRISREKQRDLLGLCKDSNYYADELDVALKQRKLFRHLVAGFGVKATDIICVGLGNGTTFSFTLKSDPQDANQYSHPSHLLANSRNFPWRQGTLTLANRAKHLDKQEEPVSSLGSTEVKLPHTTLKPSEHTREKEGNQYNAATDRVEPSHYISMSERQVMQKSKAEQKNSRLPKLVPRTFTSSIASASCFALLQSLPEASSPTNPCDLHAIAKKDIVPSKLRSQSMAEESVCQLTQAAAGQPCNPLSLPIAVDTETETETETEISKVGSKDNTSSTTLSATINSQTGTEANWENISVSQ